MQLPPPFRSLVTILPADMFLSFACLLAPKTFEDPHILEQMKDLRFLTLHLDERMSVFFNHMSDLFYFHAIAYEQITSAVENGGPLFLYLRDFLFTRAELKFYAKDDAEDFTYFKDIPQVDHSLQHMLAENAAPEFPVVTIRHLSGVSETSSLLPYKELPSLMLNGHQWQEVTNYLISVANGIVLHVGHLGEGTRIELECIRKHQKQNNTILAIEQFKTSEPPLNVIEALAGKQFDARKESKPEPLNEADIVTHFHDFQHRVRFNTNGFLVGKHLAVSELRRISEANPVRDSSRLSVLIDRRIDLPTFFPAETIKELERVLKKDTDFLEGERKGVEIIHPLYSQAALLLILGRMYDALFAFCLIAIYAGFIIQDPTEKETAILRNIGRMAACMFWCGFADNKDDAFLKAMHLYESTKANLGSKVS
jgi:hypothetical protein